MIKSTVENMANPIGFEIGSSDDNTQSSLINGFCRGLRNSIPDKSEYNTQLHYIADKLDKKSENVLIDLVEFIKAKNDE